MLNTSLLVKLNNLIFYDENNLYHSHGHYLSM